jgi:hypothetical protein
MIHPCQPREKQEFLMFVIVSGLNFLEERGKSVALSCGKLLRFSARTTENDNFDSSSGEKTTAHLFCL